MKSFAVLLLCVSMSAYAYGKTSKKQESKSEKIKGTTQGRSTERVEPAAPASESVPVALTGSTRHEISATPKSWLSNMGILAGIKSYNDFARQGDYNGKNTRLFKSKNEMFFGMKSAGGWGAFAQIVETKADYLNSDTNKLSPSDPSITLTHPALYDDGVLKIGGQYRQYFPVSDFSVNRNQWQQAYYSTLAWKLPRKYDFFNVLIPRYFWQNFYTSSDTTFYTEDYTTISRNLKNWLRLGFGQHSQIEVHSADPTGLALEVYPYADFMLSPSVYMGPRVYFPVAGQNSVYEFPKSISMSQALAELYFQATL